MAQFEVPGDKKSISNLSCAPLAGTFTIKKEKRLKPEGAFSTVTSYE
jgi:hypothetical protein